MSDHWKWPHSLALLSITIAIVMLGLRLPADNRLGGWLSALLLLAIFTLVTGHGITGLWRGALIDERNKVSLSRLQLVLWTILMLSAFFIGALGNIGVDPDPLAIIVPGQLWTLLGISTTSLVGSPLLRSNKTKHSPELGEVKRAVVRLESQGVDPKQVGNNGLVLTNSTPEASQWSDILKGEETGNGGLLDVAKLQMFFFTLILVVAYAFAIGDKMRASSATFTAFPDFSEGMLALLGISHAGYLTNKAVPHSAET